MTKKTRFWLSTSSCLSMILSASVAAKADDEKKAVELPTVQVEASRENQSDSYNDTDAPASLIKYTSPLVDTPQVVNTVTRQVLDDQNTTSLRDALRNVPGISLAAGEAGAQGDNLTIRGFSARSDIFLDGMRDFGSYNRDPFNMQEVEVLKGPDSIMFGRGSTGGIVNQESKTAELENFNHNTVTFGTDATKRATTDINEKIGDTSAFRLNLMANDSSVAGRDETENKRYGIAPTLAFGIGTDTRLDLSFLHQTEDNLPDYGIPFQDSRPARVHEGNFYGFQDGQNYLKTDVNIGTIKLEYDVNDNITFRNQLRYGNYNRDLQITEPQIPAGTPPNTSPASITAVRNQIAAESTESYLGDQADVKLKFNTFGMENNAVTGIEVSHETSTPVRYRFTGVPGTNLADPNDNQHFVGVRSTTARTDAFADSVAFYGVDTLSLNDQWDVLGGVRYDWVNSHSTQPIAPAAEFDRIDKLTSYRAGVVYKPATNGSIYASYGTSFNPSIESLALTAANANVAPEKSETYEVGTKWDLMNKKLSTSFAVFHDIKTNARTPDPNNALLNVLTGEQVVNGFETSVTGKITDQWSVTTGYAYLMSEVTKSSNPNEEGNRIANVPMHTFNAWTTYDLDQDWQIGGGANLVSARNGRTTPDAATGIVSRVPGYVTFDAMGKYKLTDSASLQLNVINLFDKYYYDQVHPAHIIPGAGRTALISTSFSF